MKQVSIREVQHHLARVLALAEEGEEIEITRRDTVVARLIPAAGKRGVVENGARPDYRARLETMYAAGSLTGSGAVDEILRGRSRNE